MRGVGGRVAGRARERERERERERSYFEREREREERERERGGGGGGTNISTPVATLRPDVTGSVLGLVGPVSVYCQSGTG